MSSSFHCFNDHSGVACCYMPLSLFLYNLQRVFVYELHYYFVFFSCMNEIIYYSSSVWGLSLISSFSIDKKKPPKNMYFLKKILKLFQMTRGVKFCFRPKEFLQLAACLHFLTMSIYQMECVTSSCHPCNTFSASESDLVINGNSFFIGPCVYLLSGHVLSLWEQDWG